MKHKAVPYLSGAIAMMALLVSFHSFSQPAQAQNQQRATAPTSRSVEVQTLQTVRGVESKINKLLQSQGGRYAFLVSDGELIRLDTQQGKIAMFNLVQGATWDTLDIPEKTIGPGNAFYEKYVQFLDKTEFNNN